MRHGCKCTFTYTAQELYTCFFKPLETTYNCIFPVGLKKAKLFKHLNIKKGFAFGRIDQIAY